MKLPIRNTSSQYGLVSQLLHWVIVAGIGLQYAWAWRIGQVETLRERYQLVSQHKSIGMTVLALAIVRLAWRAFNRPPPLPPVMPAWEVRLAAINHRLLYGLILAMPLAGWMYTSAAGYGASFFGLVDLPDFVPVNETIEQGAGTMHGLLAWVIPAVVAVHVAAALRHHFWLRDDVLRRMLPPWK